MKTKYNRDTIEWVHYKSTLLNYKDYGVSREVLKHIVTVLKPEIPLLALGADELKQAQVAEDDGYVVCLVGECPDLEVYPEPIFKSKAVNPTHNKDVPETQEDINAAWERHKSFFGGR